MNKIFFLIIPIIIGIFTGVYISSFSENSTTAQNDVLLTSQNLIENGSPIKGDPSASITILEFGDYQCTFCYRFHESSLKTIQEEYIDSGKVNLIFKDFPLNGPDSVLAAEASYCADEQGQYWEYHDELYTNWGGEKTGWITRTSLNQFAINIGLNLNQFNSCLDEHRYNQKVLELYEFGQKIGVNATPSFLIFNDEKIIKITGNQPFDVFERAIDGL